METTTASAESAPVWSVTQVNQAVRELVEGSLMPFWLGGEIGSLSIQRSGHAYFTLKDQESQLRVCWFGGARQLQALQLGNGSLVEAYGQLTVYTVRGEYQFSVKKLRPAGIGELQKRIEALKRKLEAEGLFAPERKRPIPLLPRRIGVVTSPTGAAIRDFLQIIERRFPNVNIRIYPCQVQGAGAAATVAAGVAFFNRTQGADVIVVTRGGGSMEDLYAFNEEVLVRAVAASSIPTVSAVGHEIDFTLCDFAADLRVPTPSAAAELVIGRREELSQRVQRCSRELATRLTLEATTLRRRVDRAAGSPVFTEPRRVLDLRRQQTDEAERALFAAVNLEQVKRKSRLDQLETALRALDPDQPLKRGYAMVLDEGTRELVRSSALPAGRELILRFGDGEKKAVTR